METDREVLLWFHDRLIHKYKESELYDYMHRLRHIIAATPRNAVHRTQGGPLNGMDDLQRYLKRKDSRKRTSAAKERL